MNIRIICKSLFYIWETLFWGTGEHDGRVKTTISTCVLSHVSHVRLRVIPLTAAHQTHSSTAFSRQEYWNGFSSIQFSHSSCLTLCDPWIAAHQVSLSITIFQSSLRLTSIETVIPSSHLILGRPLLFLPPIPLRIKSFPMSQLFTWGGQSTGVSALASFLPKKS